MPFSVQKNDFPFFRFCHSSNFLGREPHVCVFGGFVGPYVPAKRGLTAPGWWRTVLPVMVIFEFHPLIQHSKQ